MLLFSTNLKVTEKLTKEKFVELIIEWNGSNPFEENIIKDLEWNGSFSFRSGTDELWLAVEEDESENIVAVRYEKRETNGVIWDTDYILNLNEGNLAIQLYRSYTQDALEVDTAFSVPYYIKLLIDKGFLENDQDLPVIYEPFYIDQENIEILADVINLNTEYYLPVVYVSRTFSNKLPIDVEKLSRRLRGAAHVLVQADIGSNEKCRALCDGKNEYNGAVGIYYPQASRNKRLLHNPYMENGNILMGKIIKHIILNGASQTIESKYTWDGISASLLTRKLSDSVGELKKAKAAYAENRQELDDFVAAFDEDIERHKLRNIDLQNKLAALQQENQGLKAKLSSIEQIPVLYTGKEDEFFPGEIKEIVLDAIEDACSRVHDGGRRSDILKDILKHNENPGLIHEKRESIKELLRKNERMSSRVRQTLIDAGFEILEDGKHYKLVYYGDDRYWATMSKSPGEHRDGINLAQDIIRKIF